MQGGDFTRPEPIRGPGCSRQSLPSQAVLKGCRKRKLTGCGEILQHVRGTARKVLKGPPLPLTCP